MKIAIVNHTFDPHNGQANVNLQVAVRLARRGHQVTLIGDQVPTEIAAQANVEHVRIPRPRWLPTNLLKGHWFALKCGRKLRQLGDRFDVLHANGAILYGSCDVVACHIVHYAWLHSPFRPRISIRRLRECYHWLYTWSSARWERVAYRKARRIVAVSQFTSEALSEAINLDKDHMRIIHNGVDLEKFHPASPGELNRLRCDAEDANDTLVLFFVGELIMSRKNLDVILRAMKQCDRVTLVAAGVYEGGSYPQLISEMELDDRVTLLGHRTDVEELYRGADVFVFCSYFDSFGLVVLEAMASGTPVVTSQTVGSSSLVRQGESGFILPDASDDAALAQYLRLLRDDPIRRRRMGEAARRTAEEHGWDRVADQYETVYREVWEEKLGTGSSPDAFASDCAIPTKPQSGRVET